MGASKQMLSSVSQKQGSLRASLCFPACLQRHPLVLQRHPLGAAFPPPASFLISFKQDTPGCRFFSLVLPTGAHSPPIRSSTSQLGPVFVCLMSLDGCCCCSGLESPPKACVSKTVCLYCGTLGKGGEPLRERDFSMRSSCHLL